MSEIVLNAVLHLFALIASARGEEEHKACHASVEAYLRQQVRIGSVEQYLGLYDEFYDLSLALDEKARKQAAWGICDQLRGKLPRQEQFVALAAVLTITSGSGAEPGIATIDGIIAAALDIDRKDFDALRLLILHPEDYTALDERFLVLDDGHLHADVPARRLSMPGFRAQWTLTRIQETGTLILVPTGRGHLTINGQLAVQGKLHVLPPGFVLRDSTGTGIYASQIEAALTDQAVGSQLVFEGRGLDFRFPGSDNGLHTFNFTEGSGRLIGVMGGSGTGKSTLLSILSGTLPPDAGQILLNGRDLYAESDSLDGVIGLVPQDDLLFDDLTVRQNLTSSARLCLADLPRDELDQRVEQTLHNLGQLDIADLKVGSPLDKTISGGQRKRLNIALELIREPAVLFADEPTSGLSSADSFNVMSLLKQQALSGRLVIVVIHQPSSDIFKLFDGLWLLDKGGRPVFEGNPLEAVSYFRSAIHAAGGGEGFCPTCGNVNPEQIFNIIEMRRVDEGGHFTDERLVSPEDWHQRYLAHHKAQDQPETEPPPKDVPAGLRRPGLLGQFSIFFERNLLARLANRQYVTLNLLEAPFIALLLGLLCRRSSGESYIFHDNMNVAVFFFMSVVVSLFLGLSVSAEEIVRDRKILRREAFLNLSWASYVNAKTAYLAGLTAVQTLAFTLVAQAVLQVPDMTLATWAVLFSCGTCSCLLGLNVSSAMRSAVAVYILIPLLLIPQMLLGGSVISMDELVSRDSGDLHVPWYANVMPSRWGYEALIVGQYAENRWMQGQFEDDCAVRQADWELDYRVQELKTLADFLFLPDPPDDFAPRAERYLTVLVHEVMALEAETGLDSGLEMDVFSLAGFDQEASKQLRKFLKDVAKQIRTERSKSYDRISSLETQRLDELGENGLEQLRRDYTNRSVELAARNAMSLESIRISGHRLVQLTDLVCAPTHSAWGMAHFGAGTKKLWGRAVPTVVYNIWFLWLLTLLLYLSLYFHLPERLSKLGKR
ncbi:ATP-binding cassette domain-containing protein [Desulfovibrio ferrophilus]|uniref:ABC-type multidrug transport system, ATPase component n=1 Tax=Desulfovibrio ferrophilus TaxID=241368 RepID=A0A2Z6AWT3_9BACT|nr:ATP-binding cassette domain-containing protein [Desulfovibrio ferrophilus]BBD07712.1 ABC-type multidrug transport system, ATPase component [Desulfovibrio ferrophilus]